MSSFAGMKIGLLGGSFNPAHQGHLYVSEQALKRLGLDQIWWLVSPQNPLKPKRGMAPFDKRLASAQDMARHPRIHVSALERKLGTTRTFDTLTRLQQRWPDVQFVWLMGADNLARFHRWYRWRDIMTLVPVAVFDRGGSTMAALTSKTARRYGKQRLRGRNMRGLAGQTPPVWAFFQLRLHPASATEIRKKGW